ncbi:hypothetical protein ABTK13_23685, partial [Acinetobacter baumannii]
VVNRINRRPVQEETCEATYAVYVVCERSHQADVHERLIVLLDEASYPVRSVDQHPFGQNDAEIEAMLYAAAVVPEQLD